MPKFLHHKWYFRGQYFEKRPVFYVGGPEGPGEKEKEKPKPAGEQKEGVNLDDPKSPENAKFAEQFKKDYADKIKDGKMKVTHVQDNVTYEYTFEAKADSVTIKIQKVNKSEEKEKGETNPLMTEITFARLYSGKIFGMPEVPKVLEANKAQPAAAPVEIPKTFAEAKKTLSTIPKSQFGSVAFQKSFSDSVEKWSAQDKTELQKWLAGTKYKNPTEFQKDLKEGKVSAVDMETVYKNAGITPAPEAPKAEPEKKEGPLNKEQAEKEMTEKVLAILRKYETMDPKTFTDTYKSVDQVLGAVSNEINDFIKEFYKRVDPKTPVELKVNGFYMNTSGPAFSSIEPADMRGMRAFDWAHKIFVDRSEAVRSPDDYKETSALMARITDYVNGEGITSMQEKIAKGEVNTMPKFKDEINAMFDTFISKKLKRSDYNPKGRDMNMWISVKGVPVQLIFEKGGNITWSYKGSEAALAYRFLSGTEERNSPLAKTLGYDDNTMMERAEQTAETQRQTRNLAVTAWADSFRGIAMSLDAFKKGDSLDFSAIDQKLVKNVEGILAKYKYDRNLLKGFGFNMNDYNFDYKGERHYYHFNFDANGKLVIDHSKEKTRNKDLAEAQTKQKMQDFFKKYQDMPPKEFMQKFKTHGDFHKQFMGEFEPFINSFALAEKDQKIYVELNGYHVEKTSGGSRMGYDNDNFYQSKKKAAEKQ